MARKSPKTSNRTVGRRKQRKAPSNPALDPETVTEECGFIVDDEGVVREFLGHTAPLLGFVPGSATLDIRRIVRADLTGPMSEALSRAQETKSASSARGALTRIHGKAVRVDFHVSPVGNRRGHWKIIARCETPSSQGTADPEQPVTEPPIARIRRLQEELRRLRDEENQRQNALISELEDALVSVREVQEELEISNAELEASNIQLTASIAERETVQEQLARSESAAQEVLETASQAILAVSESGKIVRANELAHSMFGYESGNLAGRRVGALIPHGLRKLHSGHVKRFFERPERRPMGAGRDLWGVRQDGTQFPVEVGLSSIAGEEERLAIAFISDITERKRNEREIIESRARLRQLTTQLLTAAEDETRKWSRELHDVYTQRLVAVAMEIDRLTASTEEASGAANDALRALGARVRSLADDVHRMSRRMHPAILDDLGLVAALRSELSAFQKQHGIAAGLRADAVGADIPRDVALTVYRIAQEALNNIRKHAGADRVRVELSKTGNALTMAVRDEGRGFDPVNITKRGLGLLSMEERAQSVGGTLSIESSRGQGTAIRVRIPLGPEG